MLGNYSTVQKDSRFDGSFYCPIDRRKILSNEAQLLDQKADSPKSLRRAAAAAAAAEAATAARGSSLKKPLSVHQRAGDIARTGRSPKQSGREVGVVILVENIRCIGIEHLPLKDIFIQRSNIEYVSILLS